VQFPFRIAVLSMWGLSIPLAWLLGMQTPLALTGVWIAYAADEWVRGLGNLWRWRRGYWRGYAHEARARIEAGQAA
jgi:Na+-driven multidrug efflux pump